MKYLISLLILTATIFAQDNLDFEDDFLQSLEEVSEIATKTKLNIDDSPSFVTVLHSNRLRNLGITNVFEALALVPGVQLKREASGVPVVIFRGVSQKGEVKLMIDGITINNNYRGSIYHYLDFPIEMIKRIEVIRGAGSILYGSGAISGVVNIITNSSQKDSKNSVFISGGTYDSYKGGALVSGFIGDFKLTLDTYYQESAKMIEKSDRHLKDYSVGINISDEHFTLIARVKQDDIGNAYGILGIPDLSKENYNNENNTLLTQISYKNNLSKNNQISLFAGYTRYGQDIEAAHPKIPMIDATYRESAFYSQIDFINSSLNDNELLIGAKLESAKTTESKWSAGPPYISNPDFSRDTISLYLNDQYSISSDFDISAGLRYDHYSDFGNSLSPNLGLVYRVHETVSLKALYSHAFRAPSWIELTSNPDLQAEKSNSIETGVIYKPNEYNTLRLNLYASNIEDMIEKEGKTYEQHNKHKFYGTELEYIFTPNNATEINLLTSYIEAKKGDGEDIPDIANLLASASLTYELDLGVTFGSLLKYVSSTKRAPQDTREKLDDSFIFDQTISYQYKDITTSLIIKDLFDKSTLYTLPPNSAGFDFNDGGRSFILSAGVEF